MAKSKQPAESTPADESYRVPAVERAFQILRLIAGQGPLPLTDIVEGTGLNKSTAFYTLRTLVSLDMVLYNELGRRYELGPGLMELGAAASEEMNDIAIAKRYLAELLERMNVTIVLYRRVNPFEIMLVDKIERVHRVRITLQAGTHVPIQGGSFGRAFLAFDPPKVVEEVLRGGLQAFTPRSVTNIREFKRQLGVVREQGWAVDHEGYALGVSTVAAPIFGPDGTISVVAAAVGFTSVLTNEIAEEYGRLLRETCDRIGRTIPGQAVAAAASTGQVGAQWKSARQT